MKAVPILRLKDEEITSLFNDAETGFVLVGTSHGRILRMRAIGGNAYSSGQRSVYASYKDGYGNISGIGQNDIVYALVRRIVSLLETKKVERWKTVSSPYAADASEKMVGVYTSQIMDAGQDFGWWETLSWGQSLSDGVRIAVGIRTGTTSQNLMASKWIIFRKEDSGEHSINLDGIRNIGPMAQIRILLETDTTEAIPITSFASIGYRTKFATYFFTTKLVMKKGTNATRGLVTASYTEPQNTEVKFGVAGTNSSEWKDYTIAEIDKSFAMPIGDRFKVGIKFISYDTKNAPSVDEFAISMGADMDNLLNQ